MRNFLLVIFFSKKGPLNFENGIRIKLYMEQSTYVSTLSQLNL